MYYTLDVRGETVILFLQGNVLLSFGEDAANPDWQRYQEWRAEGNTPEPWPPAE